ncbi:MAG: family 43 glycosylhydrolase, partial [Lachnospiraceae bacterium]|nr:family 43 glycosylhydrolase [Lachnospiraceae bacterium]
TYTRKKGKIWTWGIRCYSSEDLINWKDEGHIIDPKPDDKDSLFHPFRRLDRPHLLFNPGTGKYVLWLKYNDKAHFSVLTADHLKGPYSLVDAFLQPDGRKVGDFDLAMDEATGEGYLYVEMDHTDVLVYKLSDDFCGVTGEKAPIYTGLQPPLSREGLCHFVHKGKHYLLSSGMIGYVPNPSEAAISDNYMGPYAVQGNPHVEDNSSASFNSQIASVFRIRGTDTFVAAADRWVPNYVMTKERYDSFYRAIYSRADKTLKPGLRDILSMLTSPMMGSADTSIADYVWLPIEFEGEQLRIRWKDSWTPEAYR